MDGGRLLYVANGRADVVGGEKGLWGRMDGTVRFHLGILSVLVCCIIFEWHSRSAALGQIHVS